MFSMRKNDGIDAEFLMLVVLEESPKFFRGLVRSTVGSVPVVDHPPEQVTAETGNQSREKQNERAVEPLFFCWKTTPLCE
mmetsp:Transcript_11061/g.15535  ORF Transcript_11061/g.15535 Transcript_11061/m.15535 type:complete len:80 (+) Transcript_11061:137-376(+)